MGVKSCEDCRGVIGVQIDRIVESFPELARAGFRLGSLRLGDHISYIIPVLSE